MSECEYCRMIEKKEGLIYEDDKIIALISPKPSCEGHILLMPKKHYVIIEQVPDYIVSNLYHLANKISVAAFDTLNALGSNILIQNGNAAGQKVPHVCVNILPRKEGDGLDFSWKPKQLSEEEMSTIELQMKEICETIGNFEKEGAVPVIVAEQKKSDTTDYREKDFFRIP